MDYKKFRRLLAERYGVAKAYMFIGFVARNASMYRDLQNWGYHLVFKPTVPDSSGELKGNCDAELVLQAMIDFDEYEKAIIVSGDGDFHCLIDYLLKQDKLAAVISPNIAKCSSLIKKRAHEFKLAFVEEMRPKLEYFRTHK